MRAIALVALALVVPGCAPPIAETATLPPRPLQPSPSAQVIGVVPAPPRGETETPVTRAEAPAQRALRAP